MNFLSKYIGEIGSILVGTLGIIELNFNLLRPVLGENSFQILYFSLIVVGYVVREIEKRKLLSQILELEIKATNRYIEKA